MKFLRVLAVLCLITFLCSTPFPVVSATVFSDVSWNHWAYHDIMAMQTRGLIQGNDGKFRPEESMSNQAFLSMLCRAAGLDDRTLETPWSAEPAMAYGWYMGWFEDEELTQTNKNKPITREFAAKLLVNALFPDAVNKTALNQTIHFRDEKDITKDRLPYVQTAVRLGLMEGYDDGAFCPQDNLTRAAAATLLNRALEQSAKTLDNSVSVQVPILMYHDGSY